MDSSTFSSVPAAFRSSSSTIGISPRLWSETFRNCTFWFWYESEAELNLYLSDSTHEGLHVRGALAILAKNPESSSVNLGQTKCFKVTKEQHQVFQSRKSTDCFKVTFFQVTFTPLIPENASSSFSIIMGRNVSNLKTSGVK